jgi:hypothetical protein
MAIYSCNLASIGRTTHAAGTAGAHLRYITREDAKATVHAHAMPFDPNEARIWMDRAEAADRKNARVADKIRLAIPKELDHDQRTQLVRDFCEDVTGNRVSWMFAIHQDGKDAHNPHAHVVIRDRDLTTGKRVLRLSDSARDREASGLPASACHWIRERWERCANLALERAGCAERIDRRTLEAQGIDRTPTIHIGPRAIQIDEFVRRPRSRSRTNGAGREIRYADVDQGRTRKDRHFEIVDLNLERAARSPDVATRAWALFEREQARLDRRLEAQLADVARRCTAEERRLKADFRRQLGVLRTERATAYRDAVAARRRVLSPQVAAMRTRQADARIDLHDRQRGFWPALLRAIDITGATRRKHQADRRALVADHKAERAFLAKQSRMAWLALKFANDQRFAPEETKLLAQRNAALAAMREMHGRASAMADARRQLREADRERQHLQTAELLAASARCLDTRIDVTFGAPRPRRAFSKFDGTAGQPRRDISGPTRSF